MPTESTPGERRAFLASWAQEHPGATVEAARNALRERYGVTISTKDLVTILRSVKHAQVVMVQRTLPDPTYGIADFVAAMRQAGIKRIEINPDGTYVAELFGTILAT